MWSDLLRDNAAGYARVAMTNIEREFPSAVRYLWTGPDDRPPRPQRATTAQSPPTLIE